VCGNGGLEPERALVAGLVVRAHPDAAHVGGADMEARQAQLVGDALGAVGGLGSHRSRIACPTFLQNTVRMRILRPAPLLDQGTDAADLEGVEQNLVVSRSDRPERPDPPK